MDSSQYRRFRAAATSRLLTHRRLSPSTDEMSSVRLWLPSMVALARARVAEVTGFQEVTGSHALVTRANALAVTANVQADAYERWSRHRENPGVIARLGRGIEGAATGMSVVAHTNDAGLLDPVTGRAVFIADGLIGAARRNREPLTVGPAQFGVVLRLAAEESVLAHTPGLEPWELGAGYPRSADARRYVHGYAAAITRWDGARHSGRAERVPVAAELPTLDEVRTFRADRTVFELATEGMRAVQGSTGENWAQHVVGAGYGAGHGNDPQLPAKTVASAGRLPHGREWLRPDVWVRRTMGPNAGR